MKEQGSPLRLIMSVLQGERKEISIILLYGVGASLMTLAIPVGVQTLVNTVMLGQVNQPVIFLLVAVFFGLALGAFLRALQIRVVELFQTRFFSQIALELAYRIPRFKLDLQSQNRFPELVNRFFDVLTVQKTSANLLLEGFGLALQVSLGLLLLTTYHWFLLAYAIGLIFCITVTLTLVGRGAVQSSVSESAHKYRVAAWLEEIASKQVIFRSASARKMVLRRADKIVSGYLKARGRHFRILFRQVVGFLALQVVASVVLLGIGAWLVVNNQLSLGQLVAAEIIVTGALGSLAKFQKHLESYYDLVAALDKVKSLLSVPLEENRGHDLEVAARSMHVEFRNVTYSHDKYESVFEHSNLVIEGGERIAVVGSNGSGKTTLLDLIYGLREPSTGVVLYNGVDQRELQLEGLREHVALVREREIIPGSIYENLCFDREGVRAQDARDALRMVGLLDDVHALAHGIWTSLGPEGSPLSVAQVNALSVARAIVSKPKLLLVDEVLDNLDDQIRAITLRTLLDPDAPWTLVVTTHSHDIVKQFSTVWSLDQIRFRRSA